MTFMQIIEKANARGIGQFHVFEDGKYHSTWHSYGTAVAVAKSEPNRRLYNDSGKRLT